MERNFLLFLLLCMGLLHAAIAQAPKELIVSTDRPSVGTGTDLVPVHGVLLENGVGWSVSGGQLTVDGPETLVRSGVTGRLELRCLVPNLLRSSSVHRLQHQDALFGVKLRLPAAKAWPVSAVLSLSEPAGSSQVSSGRWDPSALLTVSHAWSPHWSGFASANRAWVSTGRPVREQDTQLAFDALWGLPKNVTGFVEWAPLFRGSIQQFGYTSDLGALWVLKRRIQVDGRLGSSVDSSGNVGTVAGVGFSVLLHR